jgi:adenylate cyclase
VYNWESGTPQADRLGANELISRALAIDPNNYFAHYAWSLFLAPQRPDEAIVEAERTLALNPSSLPAYISLWIANWTAGRTEKADQYLDEALRLSPHDSLAVVFLGEKGDELFNQSRYEEATEFSNARSPWLRRA